MALEDEKRFNLHWNFLVASLKIELKGVNPIERDIVHTCLGLWNDNPLGLRMILADVQASKNVVVKIAGGIEAIAAMRKRLGTNTVPINTEGRDKISSSATHSNLPPPEPQKSTPDIEILDAHSPSSSLPCYKKKIQESVKSLEEDKKTSISRVKDLMKKVVEIEKNNSKLTKTAENAEWAAIDGIFDAEKNIFN
ncbi:uncharacterized protein DS421_15g514850 [Arachis hypogaea]|nr:uncharacterized protein DS421_15g514850 [Arachis hypogaea]